MNIIDQHSISVKDWNSLRDAVGWGALCEEQAKQCLDHSAFVISCYDGDQIVGTARVNWDYGYVAYLGDVMVMPAYQRKGIGEHMVTEAIAFVKSQLKEGWIIMFLLLAAKGKEPFYERLGFQKRPNEHAGAGMSMWIK